MMKSESNRPELQAPSPSPSPSPFPPLGPFDTLQPMPVSSSRGDAMAHPEPVRIHAQRPSGSVELTTSSSPGCKSGSPSSPSSPSYRRSASAIRHTAELRGVNHASDTSIGQTINSPLAGVPDTPLTRIETLTAQSYDGGAALSRPATAPAGGQDETAYGASTFTSLSYLDSPPQASAVSASRVLHGIPVVSSSSLKSRKYRNAPATPSGSSSPSRSRDSRGRSHSSAQASARYVPLLRPPPLRPQASPSPTPSMQSLQNHMFTYGLINGTLSDLHLVAFGHHYRLHRVVLAGQSGFFTSLLSGGFSEERQGANRGPESEVIAVEMDRPLSRAAFEFVLARLYGGGPELVPPPWAKTSAKKPLSEAWERLILAATGRMVANPKTSFDRDFLLDLSGCAAETDSEWSTIMAPTSQPATPTFLLSLLATATYLEIPAIQSLAMHWIQKTITPWTVAQYLGFALGKGLGSGSLSPELDAPCRGLESVGAPYKLDGPTLSPMTETEHASTRSSRASSISSDEVQDGETAWSSDTSMFVDQEGERIGEACACWLAKWGAETLTTEEWLAARVIEMDATAGMTMDRDDFLSRRRQIIEPFFYDENRPACFNTHPELAPPSLAIWSSIGGIDARWVRGVISSDAFFIAHTISSATTKLTSDLAPEGLESDGEFQRYLFAKRVVEMRRSEKLDVLNRPTRSRLGGFHNRNSPHSNTGERGDSISENLGLLDLRRTAEGSFFESNETYLMAANLDGMASDVKCPGERQTICTSSPSHEPASSARIDLSTADEMEYALLFQDGIHYNHMVTRSLGYLAQTYRQLNLISNDYSMTSHVLFAPIKVIQRAHWQIEQFKSRLPLVHTPRSGQALEMAGLLSTSRVAGPAPVGRAPPLPGELVTLDGLIDIGFATSVNPYLDVNVPALGLQPFYRIPIDDTSRINDRAPHPDSTPSLGLGPPSPIPPRKPNSPLSYGPDGFFGLAREQRLGTRGGPHRGVLPGSSLDLSSEWVEYAPLRLSAEFWGVTALRDNARLYSNTFFYAGSFYNLYLQRLQRKGGNQLGIYLHRQNSIEHFPTPSTPPARLADEPPYSDVNAGRSASYSTAILAPYTDQRKQLRAFFSIWVPTQLGSSMTKFSSGPDSFALSQSWGWKSTSLSSEYLGATPIEASQTEVAKSGPYSSLRVTIIMGLV
ncbi:BQ2448_5860 [Microbotryum intermedium]|uniref:BQ2448_5860 protein n=1 Tax=Microbotryum intermedium TaxID=269621 RepID=A0A238F5U7_9BASI|nr:BQ2448_5860 [Microbotryum intermedium]